MIINRYHNRKINRLKQKVVPQCIVERRAQNKYKEYFFQNVEKEPNFPQTIELETFNRCNGECSFCPANKYVDTRKPIKMKAELYEKIINELGENSYNGTLGLFSNNEPLLDERIYDFASFARKKLPNAWIYIYTNGTLIDKEKCGRLINFIDEIVIDNYNNELKLNDNVKDIAKICDVEEKWDRIIHIEMRKKDEILWTRGGQSPNNQKRVERSYPCILPFGQMVIRPDGKISLCCNDAMGKMTLGDLTISSIKEIYASKEYKSVRNKILRNHISSISLCRYCDSKHKLYKR